MANDEDFSTEEIPHGKMSKQVAKLTADVEELKQKINDMDITLKNINNILNKVVRSLGD